MAIQNGAVILEDNLAASYKAKHTLTMPSRNCALWYLPKGAEFMSTHKPAQRCSFITATNWKQPRYLLVDEWIISFDTARKWDIITKKKWATNPWKDSEEA